MLDELLLYFLGGSISVFILLILKLLSKNVHDLLKLKIIFFISLILGLISGLFFDIEWFFQGELKDKTITGKLFILFSVIYNLLNLVLIGLYVLMNKVKKMLIKT